MLVLSWPKHAFRLFHKMVWKTRKNFLTDPIFLANAVSKKKKKNLSNIEKEKEQRKWLYCKTNTM